MFLIVNIGSTSVKTKLFDAQLLAIGQLDVDYSLLDCTQIRSDLTLEALSSLQLRFESVEEVLRYVFQQWQGYLHTQQLSLSAMGHRIVHGGPDFYQATLLDDKALTSLAKLDAYAPLHNPLNRLGISIARGFFLDVPQYGVFDTAFHHSLPAVAKRYAIPDDLLADVSLQRYGFHGISCSSALRQTAAMLNCQDSSLNLIVLHLGGGSSATAIRAGMSVDTSMGFSPLGGLMMSTRSGDLDPMLLIALLQTGISVSELEELLQKNSGMKAIAGTGDMRVILQQAAEGSEAAQLAIDMYCYQIKKTLGAYCAVLGSVSAVIFTGGIGENCPSIRAQILQDLDMFDLVLDAESNLITNKSQPDIAQSHCKTRCLVVECNEELEIARQITVLM